ncbi:MAG: hypothetical protein QGI24_00920 [Kiritimatiellia bacterium]|jgi:predicted aspartyl protease|nr:hypothetical protein [Kiritimatiellia bacterium]MDP6847323.1 hypothetical protein [Kiritimatiellia bacterium]
MERNTPFVEVSLRGSDDSSRTYENCILDTGCSFELVLSEDEGKDACWTLPRHCDIRLADGSSRAAKVAMTEVMWLNKWHTVDVRLLSSCPNPLLGMPMLERSRLVFDGEGSYVESL